MDQFICPLNISKLKIVPHEFTQLFFDRSLARVPEKDKSLEKVMLNEGYDGAVSDVWSCGVILYALLTSSVPFDDRNLEVLYQKITLIHPSHYLVELNKSHGDSSLYRQIHMENINKPLKLRPPKSLNAVMEGTGLGPTYVLGNFV
ncbi:hypothetical protein Scep_025360 [Stephania cephalantha]|uniref:Protein kinase domain-containing protein n=1 Tax=Stephania cephalantha TaxID=152367 RepID=A0AAP0EI34_9MAGN